MLILYPLVPFTLYPRIESFMSPAVVFPIVTTIVVYNPTLSVDLSHHPFFGSFSTGSTKVVYCIPPLTIRPLLMSFITLHMSLLPSQSYVPTNRTVSYPIQYSSFSFFCNSAWYSRVHALHLALIYCLLQVVHSGLDPRDFRWTFSFSFFFLFSSSISSRKSDSLETTLGSDQQVAASYFLSHRLRRFSL